MMRLSRAEATCLETKQGVPSLAVDYSQKHAVRLCIAVNLRTKSIVPLFALESTLSCLLKFMTKRTKFMTKRTKFLVPERSRYLPGPNTHEQNKRLLIFHLLNCFVENDNKTFPW